MKVGIRVPFQNSSHRRDSVIMSSVIHLVSISPSLDNKTHSLGLGFLADFHKFFVKCHDPCHKAFCGE
jgi:hypothetical protein